MEQYRLIKKLDPSEDSNKDIAIKYDGGKIKSEKYGEATLSGHFLLLTRPAEFPPVTAKQVEQLEEKSYTWLKEMGQEKYRDEMSEKIQMSLMLAYTAPEIHLDKLKLYYQTLVFGFFYDDTVVKLNHLNGYNPLKQQASILKLAEFLISIIESYGSSDSTAVAASKLNPIFLPVCEVLSNVCRCGHEEMNEVDYKRFARELMNFIRGYKWLNEFHSSPNNGSEFVMLRCVNIFMSPLMALVTFAKDVRVSDDLMKHPLLQQYHKNICLHEAYRNDILSLQKEIDDNEEKNFVLMKCKKYSLQRSIYKTEKIANDLIIDLKKDKIKLESYFPTDESLKKYINVLEYMLDGFLYWYQYSKRYGKIKYETYVVEYEFDYDRWLQHEGVISKELLKEPEFRSDWNNGDMVCPSFPSLY